MSTSNNAWVADIFPYIYDAHCEILEQDDAVEVGTIAVYLDAYNQPLHSAVVSDIDDEDIICKSKWGANGLFEHHIANVPSAYTSNGSTIRVVFCNYTRTHDYLFAQNNTDTHTIVCSVCEYSIVEEHSFRCKLVNDTYHKIMCDCGATSGIQEGHVYTGSGLIGYVKCIQCGFLKYVGNTTIPIIKGKIPTIEAICKE